MKSFSDRNDFDKALGQTIDESLNAIGEPAKKIFYFHVENKYTLKQQDISKNPELFVLALKNLLGAAGTYVESLILKKICEKYDIEYEKLKNLSFEDAIKEIRKIATNRTI
ncbi:MAG: hypothetical protein IAX22_03130 [Candidatus Bathyarchaeota archaeon]|nr:hypothetical protein [Candidatus Bathyarchaeota archaeon]